ncbi:MAG: peptidoglycan bridge formation glycyltransferase FemA/FemB family protein, partial [Patescibacteria group bacterium]
MSFLQTKEWTDFQKSLGREVFEYRQNYISAWVIKHRLPFGRSYLYIPHGPEMDLNAMTGGFKNPVSSFIAWLRQLARRKKAIFVKAEPLADNITQLLIQYGFKKSKKEIQPGKTVVIDLTQSEDELLAAMHHKTRYNIKVAERHGVTVGESEDIEAFWKLMKKTTAREKFSSHPREYYQKLLGELQGDVLYTKLFVARGG